MRIMTHTREIIFFISHFLTLFDNFFFSHISLIFVVGLISFKIFIITILIHSYCYEWTFFTNKIKII